MGRAPCCEKMGLKRGPWTPEEDEILVAHIHRFGHGNWRALPKQAGLPRCGKSCRLRWINYLRPDIKRGNFTKQEEDAIIHLHQLLGNRWSAIAARLPGRTDNEIKNVWHTHLKKRLDQPTKLDDAGASGDRKKKKNLKKPAVPKRGGARKLPDELVVPTTAAAPEVSPERSSVSSSSSVTESSSSMAEQGNNTGFVKDESFTSSEEFQIDESFWSETLSVPPLDSFGVDLVEMEPTDAFGAVATSLSSSEDMDYWLSVFMDTDGVHELPQI